MPSWVPKSCLGDPRRQKVDLKKRLFPLNGTTVFEVGGSRGGQNRNQNRLRNPVRFFFVLYGFWDRKVSENDSKIAPGRHPNRCQKLFCSEWKFGVDFGAKMGDKLPAINLSRALGGGF